MTAKPDAADRYLDLATRRFSELGFHGVSLALVAQDAGVTKQAVLHYFRIHHIPGSGRADVRGLADGDAFHMAHPERDHAGLDDRGSAAAYAGSCCGVAKP